ncbi:SARP family transcriptional regulator [Paeniglutamicibacter antarcticus]|uniref:SARP family transcriptional regulator n=1 Tax=Arthrobacter terrae TaxID=2935737 RepID=A0A931CQU9_9MICC|nr:BTAD domain-containing putative transcriptional regulator [Arthrobacter terrae]MBG0737918.1 SARP family transcriptional regulator [Arthrobacter terrae]
MASTQLSEPPRLDIREPARLDSLAICLLGGPYVIQAGRRIAVPEGSKKLLVFVALHDGRVDRRHAAGTLWPYVSDDRASGNLRSALWRLKGAGIDVLEADKVFIALRDQTSIDIYVLRDWAGRVIGGAAQSTDLVLPAWSLEALDLLPGWYDDWIIFERERLRQRLLHGLEALCCQLIRLERYAEAVEVAMEAVDIDPLRESAQRVLVEAHLAEGNVAEARRIYKAYGVLVAKELGVLPGSRIRGLIERTEPASVWAADTCRR